MLIKGSKIELVKALPGFDKVGDIFEVSNITEDGVISIKASYGIGMMSYKEFEEYFKEYKEEELVEEILVDKRVEDRVTTIENLVTPNFTSKTDTKIRNDARYRLIAKRKGKTVTCTILSDIGTILGEGLAVCHDDDEFDDKIGYILAQLRAKEDWYKKAQRTFLKIHNLI